MNLHDKVVLVTGGAVRIGAAICEALADKGCHVVIHCGRSSAEAAQLGRRLKARGVNAWVVRKVLRTEADCRAVVDEARRKAGRLDILVNNAAVFHKDSLKTATEAKLKAEFGLNLFVPIWLTRRFAEGTETGSVINLLDRRVVANDTECLPYSLSKKALAAFTAEAALALAPGIVVNGVAPGAVLPPPGKGLSYLKDRAGRIPLVARTTPQQVARAVVGLLELDGVTGQVLFVDGGQHLLGNGV